MTAIIVTAVLSGVVGFMVGAAVMVKTPTPAPELPEHQHVWGEWEQMEKVNVWASDRGGDRPVAFEYTQRRTCTLCQFTEYHTDRI